jgi:hypothetical protein
VQACGKARRPEPRLLSVDQGFMRPTRAPSSLPRVLGFEGMGGGSWSSPEGAAARRPARGESVSGTGVGLGGLRLQGVLAGAARGMGARSDPRRRRSAGGAECAAKRDCNTLFPYSPAAPG